MLFSLSTPPLPVLLHRLSVDDFSLNVTFGLPPLSSSSSFSNSSLYPLYIHFQFATTGTVTFVCFTFASTLLLLPLYFLVIYMGVQQWRSQRSVRGGRSMSHSDIFTYHVVMMELVVVFHVCIFGLL